MIQPVSGLAGGLDRDRAAQGTYTSRTSYRPAPVTLQIRRAAKGWICKFAATARWGPVAAPCHGAGGWGRKEGTDFTEGQMAHANDETGFWSEAFGPRRRRGVCGPARRCWFCRDRRAGAGGEDPGADVGRWPATLQTLAVLMIGATYGLRLGVVTLLGYLALGAGFAAHATLVGGAPGWTPLHRAAPRIWPLFRRPDLWATWWASSPRAAVMGALARRRLGPQRGRRWPGRC